MAELFITLPDGRTMHYRLTGAPAVIGRDATCEITIDDPSTSRQHARFVPTDRGYVVEDMGSRNGTLVNDLPCGRTPLVDGDRILVGAALAVFRGAGTQSGTAVIIADEEPSSHATRYVPADQALALSRRRLEMICELSERLTTLQDETALLENALSICFETLHFERGAVGIRRRNQRIVDWPVVKNLRGEEGELKISGSLLRRALEHGERAIFTDSGSAPADPTVSMVQHGIRSAMCVPLIHRGQILGVIYGDRTSTSTAYTDEDIDFLAAIAREVSIGLVNSQLLEDQQQMARLSHDLDVARGIQTSLFPKSLPDEDSLSVAARNDPGRRVSGDYYDVIRRDDGRVWCVVADVSGEGVGAALLMANLQAAVRVTIGESDDPGALLTRWNQFVCQNSSQARFVTCILILVDPAEHTLRLASAGHWAPIVVTGASLSAGASPSAGVPRELEIDVGYPLGVVDSAQFKTTTAELGDDPAMIFCYTDGVIEAMDPEEEMFGHERLIKVLANRGDLKPKAIIKHVGRELAAFVGSAQQSDDITMMAIRMG